MGGFILCDENDNMIETLSIERLEDLSSRGTIHWPSISQYEIQDRSKGDFLSKAFAVLQISWFITQFIARAVYGLTITELELATLAFAVLSAILYFLWWNKPQYVARPVPVYLRHPSSFKSTRDVGMPTTNSAYRENLKHCLICLLPVHSDLSYMSKVVLKSGDEDLSHFEDDPLLATKRTISTPSELYTSTFIHYYRRLRDIVIFRMQIFWQSVWCTATSNSSTDSPSLSVPLSYPPYTDPPKDNSNLSTLGYDNSGTLSAILAIMVGMLFGGIHCIAWSFTFQSIEERYIWRTSAATITAAIPLVWGGLEVFAVPISRMIIKSVGNCFGYDTRNFHTVSWMAMLMGGPAILAYFISRVALFILPLLALRTLSPDSLLEVRWASFIPHI
jgi:hypothetical protein